MSGGGASEPGGEHRRPVGTTAVPAGVRAVAVGGGHGLARSLQALPRVVDEVTAVVTVADDGGSSGRLRRDLGVLPPGDLRMAVAALARDEDLARLLQYRFDRGELGGHSLGNLILVAMQDLAEGDVVRALDRLGRFLGVPGRVLPCTTTPVTLHATTSASAGPVTGQAAVAATPRLRRVWLTPDDGSELPLATPEAVEAIAGADLVVLGPGSLYTSLLPNLLVPGIANALAATSAPVVLVANLREQPGETEGMTLTGHLDALEAHVPGVLVDVLVVHDGAAPHGPGRPLACDVDGLTDRVGRLVERDLFDGDDGHDPAALAAIFTELLRPGHARPLVR
jgi:uncharacterized cofD-like protein